MTDSALGYQGIRSRINSILEEVLGYEIDRESIRLEDLDSLQVLELLILIEDEFGIDSDGIIENGPEWWASTDQLAYAISNLMNAPDDNASSRQ